LNVNDQTTGTNLSRTLNTERMIMELLNCAKCANLRNFFLQNSLWAVQISKDFSMPIVIRTNLHKYVVWTSSDKSSLWTLCTTHVNQLQE